MKRESGYYWIKLNINPIENVTENGWEVAYYDSPHGWCSIWERGYYNNDEVQEINETILKPK